MSVRLFTVISHHHQLDVCICIYLILNVYIEQTAEAHFRMFLWCLVTFNTHCSVDYLY